MPNEQHAKKSLSEISHLFLSSVREGTGGPGGGGGPRPTRLPPRTPRGAAAGQDRAVIDSIDLGQDEFAHAFAGSVAPAPQAADAPAPAVGPVSAVICPAFTGDPAERVKAYARHLAAGGDRVGLIEADGSGCRVTCLELAIGADAVVDRADSAADAVTVTDGRRAAEALDELAWDVDRWVLSIAAPRVVEARDLLRKVGHWVLLSTCDHDGVVDCYRAIKGLADAPRPRLSLALLNVPDAEEAGRVHRKIAGVCHQFLNWEMTAEPAVEPTDIVSEHVAVVYRPAVDRGVVPTAAGHWATLAGFVGRSAAITVEAPTTVPAAAEPVRFGGPIEPSPFAHPAAPREAPRQIPVEAAPMRLADYEPVPEPAPMPIAETPSELDVAAVAAEAVAVTPVAPMPMPLPMPIPMAMPMPMPLPMMQYTGSAADDSEVSDLPGGELTEAAVLSAVLRRPTAGLVDTSIKAPAYPAATLAVGRDRRLVLLAVAKRGLTEMRAISQAYKWVAENRPLLSMALPQFAIDPSAPPALRLVVDRADAGAEMLLPATDTRNVTVQTYRKLTWGGRTGLLVEAA